MKTSSQKMSRRGSETRQKSHLITSRYSPEEFAELDDAASRAGLTRASYQRSQSLAAPKTRSTRRPPIERELLAKLLGQLGRVGGNLNQVAHAANLGANQRPEWEAVRGEIREAAKAVMLAMGRTP
jgi:hypothetical protein